MQKLKIDLPDGFLDEEIREGYLVTSDMKKVWAVELDLFAEFDRVCRKYDITYFADAGTMLGAVRHKGFIPWDDDIDVKLSRENYEKLCQIAPKEFTGNYFWQTEYTDPGSLRGHAQLRNSSTTAILEFEKGLQKFNQGIFIDIFPFDSVIDDKKLFEEQKERAESYRRHCLYLRDVIYNYKKKQYKFPKNILAPLRSTYYRWKNKNCEKPYRLFERECARYNNIQTPQISLLSFQFDPIHFQSRADYDDIVYMPFEFMQMPVPKGDDHILTDRYGDYMKPVKGGSMHGKIIFDVDRPYTDYLEKFNKSR